MIHPEQPYAYIKNFCMHILSNSSFVTTPICAFHLGRYEELVILKRNICKNYSVGKPVIHYHYICSGSVFNQNSRQRVVLLFFKHQFERVFSPLSLMFRFIHRFIDFVLYLTFWHHMIQISLRTLLAESVIP